MSQTSNVFPSIPVSGHFLSVFAWQLLKLCILIRQIFFYSCGIFSSNFRSFPISIVSFLAFFGEKFVWSSIFVHGAIYLCELVDFLSFHLPTIPEWQLWIQKKRTNNKIRGPNKPWAWSLPWSNPSFASGFDLVFFFFTGIIDNILMWV